MLELRGAAMAATEASDSVPGVTMPTGMGSPRRCLICIPLGGAVLDDVGRPRIYDPQDADLRLLAGGGAPLLLDHRHDFDALVGVIERAWIEGGALHASARLGPTARCGEVWSMLMARVLVHVSMGAIFTPEPREDGVTYARGWRPYELSLVTVPRRWGSTVAPLVRRASGLSDIANPAGLGAAADGRSASFQPHSEGAPA